MSVSRLQGKTPIIVSPRSGPAVDVPPFWELEELVATGLAPDAALQVMAARRATPRLVGAAEPAPPARFEPVS